MGVLDTFKKIVDPIGHTIGKKVKKELGLSKLDKKLHDPFGWNKKLEDEVSGALGLDFEKYNFGAMWEQIKDDPTRILYGSFDPASTKMWNEVLGTDLDPIISQMGGPTQQRYVDYIEQGGDPRAAKNAATAHQIAATIASIYAGGALGALAPGAGAAAGAGSGAIAGSSIIPAAQTFAAGLGGTGGALAAGVSYGAAEADAMFTPEMQEQLIALGYPIRGLTAGLPGLAEGGYMGYAKGGQTQEGAFDEGKEIFDAIREVIENVPGGAEIIFSMGQQQQRGGPGEGTRPVRFYNGGAVGYNDGGLAEANGFGGRGDDEMIIHMAPEEYEVLTSMWGPGEINPNTGMPEYGFLSKLWKGIKKVFKSPLFSFLAPIALNVFAPGLGAALGAKLGLTGKMAATVGNTLVRSGMGAIGGGEKGALAGAVAGLTSGGTGADIGAKLGLEGAAAEMAGNAIIGGVGGEIGGGGFAQGAMGNVANAMMMGPIEQGAEKMMGTIFNPQQSGIGAGTATGGEMSPISSEAQAGQDIFGTADLMPEMTGAMSPVPGGAPTIGGMYSGPTSDPWYIDAGNWIKDNPLLAAAGAAGLYGLSQGGGEEEGPPSGIGEYPNNFMEGIPLYDFDRTQQGLAQESDYYTYGQIGAPQSGEQQFFANNQIGQPVGPGDGATTLPGLGPSGPGRRGPGGPGGQRWEEGREYMPPGIDMSGGNIVPQVQAAGATYLPGLDPQGSMYGAKAPTAEQQEWMNKEITGSSPYHNAFRQLQAQMRAQFPGWYNAPTPFAPANQGGYVGGYAGGGYAQGNGSGRDDTIEALLSDGEYVMDAETVALLGDGSNDAGAQRLDEMREQLRRHKGRGLSRGKFSADAKHPMQYLKHGGRARYKKGGPVEARLERIALELGEK